MTAAALLSVAALLLCGGASGKTVLTVYSPHAKDLLEHYEYAFERADSTVDVQWVDMGSQEVLDRVRAEAANPQADLWFGAPAEIFERAAKEGLLTPYRPAWAGTVPNDARDPNDLWYGTYLTPEVIAYNSDAVSDAEAPKDVGCSANAERETARRASRSRLHFTAVPRSDFRVPRLACSRPTRPPPP
jgi:iron(III) transport system substrate-binding protein